MKIAQIFKFIGKEVEPYRQEGKKLGQILTSKKVSPYLLKLRSEDSMLLAISSCSWVEV